jgi:hypothetical protein
MYDAVMNLPALKDIYNMNDMYWILRYGVEYWSILEVWYQNYSVNFYLYCIGGGRKYRNDVKSVVREIFRILRCRKEEQTPTSALSMTTRKSAAKR